MIRMNGTEPEPRPQSQGVLFDEDKRKQEKEKVSNKIGKSCEEIRADLKKAAALMTLLKEAPKIVTEIFFECDNAQLAVDHLELLAAQATKLAEVFLDTALSCKDVAVWQKDLIDIDTFVVNGHTGATPVEAEDKAIKAEIAEIYEPANQGEPLPVESGEALPDSAELQEGAEVAPEEPLESAEPAAAEEGAPEEPAAHVEPSESAALSSNEIDDGPF